MVVAQGRVHAAYSYTRRRWANAYVVMVIVCCVFVCGILGLTRIREKRSFSLLIKLKDDQILSLHHLLQKERESLAEVEREKEEMEMEITRVGSEKAEMNNRILEMQSAISSIREDHRAVETALQEKQHPQVEALMQDLRLKEAEISDLNHRLQLRTDATAGNGNEQIGERKNEGETERSSMTGKEETDRSSENGGTNADGGREGLEREKREKTENKDDEAHVTARGEGSNNQQENTHKVRGKLRRVKGKRWRSIAKGRRASPSNQALAHGKENDGEEERPVENELPNSSSELAKKPEIKMEDTGSDKEAEQHTKENEQSDVKLTKDSNEQQHTDLLGRKGGKPDAVLRGDPEESDLGEDSEEKEERNEQEF